MLQNDFVGVRLLAVNNRTQSSQAIHHDKVGRMDKQFIESGALRVGVFHHRKQQIRGSKPINLPLWAGEKLPDGWVCPVVRSVSGENRRGVVFGISGKRPKCHVAGNSTLHPRHLLRENVALSRASRENDIEHMHAVCEGYSGDRRPDLISQSKVMQTAEDGQWLDRR